MVLFVSTFPITYNKKGDGEARNEASRDHKHLLSSWPHDSIFLKCMLKLLYNFEMSIMICIVAFYDITNSPEDKRKIVQIDDTSTKFRILDPLQVGNDLR